MTTHLKETLVILIGTFGFAGVTLAAAEPQIGMKWEQLERDYEGCITSRWKRDQMSLGILFYGYPAEVIVGFDDGEKVDSLSVWFPIQDGTRDRNARLRIFEEVRRRIQELGGEVQTQVRINGADLIGNRGGVGLDDVPANLVSFVLLKDGIEYGLVIRAANLTELGQAGEIELVIRPQLPDLTRQPGTSP